MQVQAYTISHLYFLAAGDQHGHLEPTHSEPWLGTDDSVMVRVSGLMWCRSDKFQNFAEPGAIFLRHVFSLELRKQHRHWLTKYS